MSSSQTSLASSDHSKTHTPNKTIPATAFSPLTNQRPTPSPTLHEVIVADSKRLDAKTKRLRRRHAWLRANQNLLVTLLGCTVLHGSRDTGFASIRTELLLLLQVGEDFYFKSYFFNQLFYIYLVFIGVKYSLYKFNCNLNCLK